MIPVWNAESGRDLPVCTVVETRQPRNDNCESVIRAQSTTLHVSSTDNGS